jgi:hypothetical protein
MRRSLALFVVFACVGSPAVAQGDATVDRLLAAKQTMTWNYTPAGQNERYGHAESLVAAPADKVFEAAADFAHYASLHRKFATARVVAKSTDSTDLFMRYPVWVGPLKFEFEETVRFGPVRVVGGARVLEARGLHGDMRAAHAVITVKPVDATHALLQVDCLFLPRVPAPQGLIDSELREGAESFVDGLRARAQGHGRPVTTL